MSGALNLAALRRSRYSAKTLQEYRQGKEYDMNM